MKEEDLSKDNPAVCGLNKILKEVQKQFPAPTVEQSYLIWKKKQYKGWEKKFPVIWETVFKRRYILPAYRQTDYHNQEACDFMLLDIFFAYIEEKLNLSDKVMGHCINNWIAGFKYDRPTLFLERELGEPFMRMKLPLEYYVSDIKWKWPSFRVYLPKGLISITRSSQQCSAMFLDFSYVPKNVEMDMPRPIHNELTRVLGPAGLGSIPVVISKYEGLAVTLFIDFNSPEGGLGYAASTELATNTFRSIMEQLHSTLESPTPSDDLDGVFLNKILALSLNILLYLSSIPMEYSPDLNVIRPPKKEGDHLISGLYPAKFVGRSQLRPGQKGHKATIHHTGIELPPHWRGGHHRWQRYGVGNKELKLIWINTYRTGKTEEEEEDERRV